MTKDAIHGHNSASPGLHFPLSSSFLQLLTFSLCIWMSLSASNIWLFIEKSQQVQANSPRRAVAHLDELLLNDEGADSLRRAVAHPSECVAYG